MSNLSGLPPASVIRASAVAVIQDVAVRLVNLPDTLQNNPQPLKLSGTVIGQNQDGSVKLETNRGVVTLMMKDRGNLPVGQTIEIDIPAGRPPQQALIRPDPASAPTNTAQPPTQSTTAPPPATATAPPLKLDRYQNVKPDDIAEAAANAMPESDLRLSAPLQAGQILRLIPIPTNSSQGAPVIFSPEQLFTALMNMVQQATDLPIEMRQNLIQILSTVDISTLIPQTSSGTGAMSQDEVAAAFQKLVQSLDMPEGFKLKNAASQNATQVAINPNRPLDVKILAFQNGNFQAALSSALNQTPVSGTVAAPVLIPENFVVAAQPQPAAPIQTPPVVAVTPQAQALPTGETPVQIPVTPPSVTPPVVTASPPIPAAVAAPAAPAQPPAILGQVTGFTQQGQPVVSLALPGSTTPQNYSVQFVANNVTEGTPVIVAPLPVTTKPVSFVPFAIGQPVSLADWAQPDLWDSLQNLIGTVSHVAPNLAQTIAQMIPNTAAPQSMGALSLFFLSVMRTGDLDSWISQPAINLLRNTGKIDVLRQLAGESSVSNRLEAAVLPNEWRGAVLPFMHDQQVHKLPLFYKQWKDENASDEQARKERRMRFLFNLKLSRMGDVQVDGFMQKEKLDMILRTKSIISQNMQQALKKTYTKAMERSNLSGEITFQFKPEQWVHIDMPMETIGA